MTVLVDFGLLQGVSVDPSYLLLGHPTQGLLGTGTLAPDDTLADFSGRLMSMQVQHTSSRRIGPVIEYNAATATVVLLNDDGQLDPATLEAEGLTAPGVLMRIRKRHNGVVYPVFYGYVDAWMPEQRAPDHAVVTVTGTDALSRLTGRDRGELPVPVGAGESTGARINRILDSADWPAEQRVIDVGQSTLQGTTLGGDPLDELQDVSVNEIGEFYADAAGNVVFRDRHGMLTEARSLESQATFTSSPGGWVDSLGLSYDRVQLVNRVTATIEGDTAVPQTAEDAESIGRYGLYPHDETLKLTTDADAMGWATWVLRSDRVPEFRVTSMTVDARVNPDALYPQLLQRRFGDRITVVRRPPGGIVDSRQVFIRSIEHSWSPPDQWRTTWGLQPAEKYQFFVLGHPQMGALGSNSLAY